MAGRLAREKRPTELNSEVRLIKGQQAAVPPGGNKTCRARGWEEAGQVSRGLWRKSFLCLALRHCMQMSEDKLTFPGSHDGSHILCASGEWSFLL